MFTSPCVDQHPHIAAAAAVAYTVCPKCGTLEKSGKASCCGRGGSWFGHCESAGSAQLGHTWLEGIEACKTRPQFKTAMKKQRNAAQQLNFERAIATKSQEVITAATMFRFKSFNASTPIVMPAETPTSTLDISSTEYDTGKTTTMAISKPTEMATRTTTITGMDKSTRSSVTNTAAKILTTALSHPGSLGKSTGIDMTYKDATVASTSMAVVTYTAQEAISATDWVAQGMWLCMICAAGACVELDCLPDPHADSVVVGSTLICVGVVMLFLISLVATGFILIRKNTKTKRRRPTISTQNDPDSLRKDVKGIESCL